MGKCDNINTCKDTHLRAACVEGIDGPCLWVSKY